MRRKRAIDFLSLLVFKGMLLLLTSSIEPLRRQSQNYHRYLFLIDIDWDDGRKKNYSLHLDYPIFFRLSGWSWMPSKWWVVILAAAYVYQKEMKDLQTVSISWNRRRFRINFSTETHTHLWIISLWKLTKKIVTRHLIFLQTYLEFGRKYISCIKFVVLGSGTSALYVLI